MENKSQTNAINILYGLLIVSTVLGFVPNLMAFTASLVLWLITLIAAYLYRRKDTEDGLLYNHMTYLIGTIWIGTSFILLGTLIAGWWVFTNGDNTAIQGAMASVTNGATLDETAMKAITEAYLKANQAVLIKASAVAIGPAILYFVYRVANGMSRAAKGYRLANPKSWL
jgi:uncharacterized membrane protein